jgi:hypothetical protein
LELLNVHLFDDIDHIRALRRSPPAALSVYAMSRRDALRHALEMLTAAGPAPAALGPIPPSLFVFGDLNWRLDLRSVLSQLAGESALASALSAADADDASSPTSVIVPIRTPTAPDDGSSASSYGDGWGWWARHCRCLALAPPQRALVEAQRFSMDDIAVFGRSPSAFKGCDLELAASRTLAPLLDELEIGFPPTCSYLYHPSPSPGADASCAPGGACFAYDDRCCPSWRDRVLLDAAGMRLVRAASDVKYAATHVPHDDLQRSNPRQMIQLVFTLAPSATLGASPIPVHVRADVAAPVPIKVKYVAVGAG